MNIYVCMSYVTYICVYIEIYNIYLCLSIERGRMRIVDFS